MTVEMGCHIEGVIALAWAEYGSAELEIRYGSQIELASKLKSMVRRSTDRLGYQLDIQGARALLGTPAERRLLMSNSEFSRLPAAERLAGRQRAAPQPVVQAQHAPGYYARSADAAASAMAAEFTRRQQGPVYDQGLAPPTGGGVSLSWADETEFQTPLANGQPGRSAPTPHFQNESELSLTSPDARVATPHGNAPKGRVPPVPSGPPIRQAPAPSTVSTSGRVAPPPSTAAG
jgi:hypothetical protein